MPRLLFVSHCPSPNTESLRDAALTALSDAAFDGIVVDAVAAPHADQATVRRADGILIGTTENFGSMAGLIKDFFERIYYPCLDQTVGLPVAVYVRAGEDGRGTRRDVERIITGLKWKPIQPTLILRGEFDPAFREQVAVLAQTLAAGLDAGIF